MRGGTKTPLGILTKTKERGKKHGGLRRAVLCWVCTKLLLMESGNQSLAGPDTLHAARGRLVEAGSTGAFSSNGMYVPENARVAAQRLLVACHGVIDG